MAKADSQRTLAEGFLVKTRAAANHSVKLNERQVAEALAQYVFDNLPDEAKPRDVEDINISPRPRPATATWTIGEQVAVVEAGRTVADVEPGSPDANAPQSDPVQPQSNQPSEPTE